MHASFLSLILLCVSCAEPAQETRPSTNPHVPVELLFEVDGCRVYRFQDGGRDRYFAKCPASASTMSTESCGKHCTRDVEVPTTTGL